MAAAQETPMPGKVAINGLGRIGQVALKLAEASGYREEVTDELSARRIEAGIWLQQPEVSP
jgi:threonine dehydrogenase-like Zn-dependent dehydrogenase